MRPLKVGTPRAGGGHSVHEIYGVLPPPYPPNRPRCRPGARGAAPLVPALLPPLGAGSPPPLPGSASRPAPLRRGQHRPRRAPAAAPGSGMVLSVLAGVCLAATLAMFATGL